MKRPPHAHGHRPSTSLFVRLVSGLLVASAAGCGKDKGKSLFLERPKDPSDTQSIARPGEGTPNPSDEVDPRVRQTPSPGNDDAMPMPPSPDLPPEVAAGVRLYATHCQTCHGSVEASTKRGKTAQAIQAAIRAQPTMQSLSFLRPVDHTNIAQALAFDFDSFVPSVPRRDPIPLLSTRLALTSALRNLFWNKDPETRSQFNQLGAAPFASRPTLFGFPCFSHESDSGNCPGEAAHEAPMVPASHPVRSALIRTACENLSAQESSITHLLGVAFGEDAATALPEDPQKVSQVMGLFLPGYELRTLELQGLTELARKLQTQGRPPLVRWSAIASAACQHPQFEMRSHVNSKKEMTPLGVYARCYEALTHQRPDPASPQWNAVATGTKTPTAACLETLAQGRLQLAAGSTNELVLAPSAGGTGAAVLNTFHALHASWLHAKEIPNATGVVQQRHTRAIYDPTIPASYFTRALFFPGANMTSVFRGRDFLTPLRTNREPSGGGGGVTLPTLSGGRGVWTSQAMRFADRGQLRGLRIEPGNTTWSYTSARDTGADPQQGVVRPFTSLGGGVLGNTVYVLMNAQGGLGKAKDGATNVPRKWSQALVNDFLCRSLPVLNNSDVTSFVNANSSTSFRLVAGCTSCHATMDPLAGLIRSARLPYNRPYGSPPTIFIYPPSTEQAHPNVWSSEPDALYANRPATGRFIYRNLNNQLVNTPVANMDALGNALMGQDDLYSCLAGRYYEYFMGVPLEAARVASSRHNAPLRALAAQLKQDKDVFKLVENILRLPHYAFSDFEPNE